MIFISPSRLAFGVWRLAFGVWRLAFGVRRLAFGVWRSAFGVRRSAFGGARRGRVALRGCAPARPAWRVHITSEGKRGH
jgi:hypothetical protein